MFGLTILPEHVAIIVLAALLTALVVGFFLRKDHAREERRKAVNATAAKLRQHGLVDLAEILECYVVGDYTDLVQGAVGFARLAGDPAKFDGMLLRHFKVQLPLRLQEAETGRWIIETVEAFKTSQAAVAGAGTAAASAAKAA